MFSTARKKLRGWKTIIWARALIVVGVVPAILIPILDAIDGSQIGIFIPPKYTPFIPLILVVVGMVTEWLRRITTGPVGSKGTEEPAADAKAGD